MTHGSKAFRLSAAFAAFGIVLSSTASAAPSGISTADPLVSLSIFGTSSSRAAVCAAGAATTAAATSAAATAAQPGPGPGCVLPVLGAPPPVVTTVPPPVGIVEPVAVGGLGGLGSLLPLFALGALAALGVYFLEKQDEDFPLQLPDSPV